MTQSRPSLAKDEQQSPLTPLSKEIAGDAPSVDNLHSDLDAEPNVARGAGAFASAWLLHTFLFVLIPCPT
jgi:hypothetical protein